MPTFNIRWGLNGGFGGIEMKEWEQIEAISIDEALEIAYENAIGEYESYEGMHGLRNIDQIIEEENVEEDDAIEIYTEEREAWIDYDAKEVK